jgi:hypothetical protein
VFGVRSYAARTAGDPGAVSGLPAVSDLPAPVFAVGVAIHAAPPGTDLDLAATDHYPYRHLVIYGWIGYSLNPFPLIRALRELHQGVPRKVRWAAYVVSLGTFVLCLKFA